MARYRSATGDQDAEVTWVSFAGPRIDLGKAARLPGVAGATRMLDVIALGLVSDTGVVANIGDFRFKVPIGERSGTPVDRPLVRAGRLPSAAHPDEVMVDELMASTLGLRVGSSLRVRLLTTAEAGRILRGDVAWTSRADPRRTGAGPLVRLRVVGIQAWLGDSGPRGELIASPSFARRYRRYLGDLTTPYLAVRLRHGQAGLAAFAKEVTRLYPRAAPVHADSSSPFIAPTANTVRLQATTIWLLAAAAALVALAGVAPALARRTSQASTDRAIFRVLGLRSRSLVAAGLAGPFVVAIGAAASAFLAAVAASPLTAVGLSRPFDPASGVRVDAEVLGPGSAAVAVGLFLVGAAAAWRAAAAARTESRSAARPSVLGSALAAARLAPVPLALGVRSALARGSGRARAPVVSATGGIAVMFTVVAAGVVVAASSTRLLDTPRLYGQDYVVLGSLGTSPPAVTARVARTLGRDRAVAAAAEAALATVTIRGRSVGLVGTRQIKGVVPLSLTAGREPAGPGEIALGRRTLAALGLGIGDTVRVHGADRTSTMRVVGDATLPFLFLQSQGVEIGDGAAVTLGALRTLAPGTPVSRILVQPAPGVDPVREVATLAHTTGSEWDPATRPEEIGKITHVRAVPYVLVGLLAAAGIAALAHLLTTTTRRGRRDIAILKTLGLRRRDVRAAVFAQSATTVGLGCLLGAPAGVVLGFWTWNVLAARMGVVAEPVLPPATALLVPGAAVLCVLVALVPAATAARVPVAAVLRTE